MDKSGKIGIIVAHPDDEILWAGGAILSNFDWECKIFVLCRLSDRDRSNRFKLASSYIGASGNMADLDDGPEQIPISAEDMKNAVLDLLGLHKFDIILTHHPLGEYTRHRRHEEVSKAVIDLWKEGKINSKVLWLFAYKDNNGKSLPKFEEDAHKKIILPQSVWKKKYYIITEIYGFSPESWETRTTPRTEAFWRFDNPDKLSHWLKKKGISL